MPDNVVTIIGNITAEPVLRFTQSGSAVANFVVAQTPRVLNRQTNEWTDGDPLFMRCNIWRDAAEHASDSLAKGTRVIVTGNLKQRSYEKDGIKHTIVELEVDEVGPSLKFATAKVYKTTKNGGGRAPTGDNWSSGGSTWATDDDSPPF